MRWGIVLALGCTGLGVGVACSSNYVEGDTTTTDAGTPVPDTGTSEPPDAGTAEAAVDAACPLVLSDSFADLGTSWKPIVQQAGEVAVTSSWADNTAIDASVLVALSQVDGGAAGKAMVLRGLPFMNAGTGSFELAFDVRVHRNEADYAELGCDLRFEDGTTTNTYVGSVIAPVRMNGGAFGIGTLVGGFDGGGDQYTPFSLFTMPDDAWFTVKLRASFVSATAVDIQVTSPVAAAIPRLALPPLVDTLTVYCGLANVGSAGPERTTEIAVRNFELRKCP